MKQSLLTIWRGLTRPARLGAAVLVAGCMMVAAFGTGFLAFAQSALPGSSWTLYGNLNITGAPLFRTPEEALNYYFASTQSTAPYTQACRRYYSNYYPQGVMQSARRANGAWVFDCNLSFAPSGSFGASFVGAPQTCSAASTNSTCFQALTAATAKSAGMPPCEGTAACGNPINPGTGNKYQQEDDFAVPGSPWLGFSRHYNSAMQAALGSDLGPKWRHSFDYQVIQTAAGVNRLLRPDGSVREFNGLAPVDAEEKGALSYRFDAQGSRSGWLYDTRQGLVEQYDIAGRLLRIDTLTGGWLAVTYVPSSNRLASIADHFGRSVSFTYSGSLLTKVASPGGRSCNYAYAPSTMLLESVTCTGGGTRRYVYDEAGLDAASDTAGQLTGIVDESGARFATFSYDSRGRALSTEHAGGVGRFSVSYNDSGAAVVTTPSGAQQSMTFSQLLGVARLGVSTLSCPGQGCVAPGPTTAAYDARGNQTEETRPDGSRTCTSFDLSRNLPLRVVETSADQGCAAALASPPAQARVTQMEWHPTLRVPLKIAAPGQLTYFQLDEAGRATQVTRVLTEDNGAAGFAAAGVSAPRTVSYTYDAAGQLLSLDGPRTDVADVVTFAYDTAGNLVKSVNELGQATLFSGYDVEGRVGQIVDPSGRVTSFQYDAAGRLTTSTVAGLRTTYAYDSRGLLLTEMRPSGQALAYTYDAAQRRVDVTDQRGDVFNVTRNAAGGLLRSAWLTPQGVVRLQVDQAHDGLNRVLSRSGAHVASHTALLLNP